MLVADKEEKNNLQTLSTTEQRVLKLLGAGHSPEIVASSVGISPSRVSQLLATEEFAKAVATIRYEQLIKHTERDSKYDDIEDKLLEKLNNVLELMYKPTDILRFIQVINQAKRRGAPDASILEATERTNVIKLNMPVTIMNRFVTNIHNQVVEAGNQTLVTIQSGSLKNIISEDNKDKRIIDLIEDKNKP